MPKPNPLARRLIEHFGYPEESFSGRCEKTARIFKMSTEAVRLWYWRGIPLRQALEVERKSRNLFPGEAVLRDVRRRTRRAMNGKPAPATSQVAT